MVRRRRVRPSVAISSSQRAVRVPRKRIAELIALTAREEGVRLEEVDVAVVRRQEIAALNHEYLGRRGATDVLSFDLTDESDAGLRCQVVVCGDVAARQGPRHGVSAQCELLLYVLHGLLHVLGYDDQTAAAADRMHRRQQELRDALTRKQRRRRRRSRSR